MKQTALFIILLCGGGTRLVSQEAAPFPDPPSVVPNKVTLADEKEPGERIIIKGVVYRSDGKTPFAGTMLYFYQTDASGVYNKKNRSWKEPRLHGWIKTDEHGGYAIRTIKPGSYPGGNIPAHIHITVKYSNGRTKWLEDFLFLGDAKIAQELLQKNSDKGTFSAIVELHPQTSGPFYGRRDIVIPEP